MADEIISRDQNFVTVLAGVTDDASQEIRMFRINPSTGRLLVSAIGVGAGTVTDVSVVSANGFAGSVANSTTTPAITLSTTINAPVLAGNGTAIAAATTTGSGSTVVLAAGASISGATITTSSVNGVTLTTGGSATAFLNGAGAYTTPSTTAALITVANEGTDTSCFIAFFTAATGDLQPKTNAGLTFNSNTALLTSTLIAAGTSVTTPALLASANDSGALGASGTAFSDLFLASGAVIDFLAGAVTITHSANTLTIAGSAYTTLALGATSITMTGSIAATGARVTKGWFTDLESTNAPTVSGAAVYYVGGTDVAVTDGGTGKSSWTQYLIPYADTTTSFSQIAIGTAGQALTSNGAGAAPTFQSLPKYITVLNTVFEATGRFDTFGTNDATVTVGVHGMDLNAAASQNGGRLLYTDMAVDLSSIHSIVGFIARPRNGEGSGEVCYVGYGEATGLTITDTAITYTSRSNFGIKLIGDGSTQDVSATNANRSGTETATEIISNPAFTDPINVNAMEYTGGTNIVWRSGSGAALATHTTNLPTTAMSAGAGQFIVTQNTEIWVDSFTLTIVV